MSISPHRRRQHDQDLCDALGIETVCSDYELAQAIREAAGIYQRPPLSISSCVMFNALAEELAVVLWEQKPVLVEARAKRIAWEVVRSVDACDAPGSLLALAPGRRVPGGSVLDLHRASRAILSGAVTKVAATLLRRWADYAIINEVPDSGAA